METVSQSVGALSQGGRVVFVLRPSIWCLLLGSSGVGEFPHPSLCQIQDEPTRSTSHMHSGRSRRTLLPPCLTRAVPITIMQC